MRLIDVLTMALLVLVVTGCTAQQRKVAAVVVSNHPTATIEAEYAGLEAKVDAATDIIQSHFAELDQADRAVLKVVFSQVNTLKNQYNFALQDPESLRAMITEGVRAYRSALPILLRNQEVFSGEEWRILAEADVGLKTFAADAKAVTTAAHLKRMAVTVKKVLEIGAAVAF